ncbi:MAG: Omp28-related outer membrane protein [Saprospiraceae bacterium]|nr:Omp28-related outer membrane protein [Saprospiraceae bacterium]
MMKKLYLIASILLFAGVLGYSQAKKYITLQHFTNTGCPSCASANPGFYTKLFDPALQGSYHHFTVHPSFPYSTCPLYQANKEQNSLLTKFYNINSTPMIVINGTKTKGAGAVTSADLSADLNSSSAISIVVSETGTTSKTVNVEIKTVGTKPGSSYKLMVVAVEKQIDLVTANRERVHYNVFRTMVSPAAGESITLANTGSSVSFVYNYTVNSAWNENQMYAIAYLYDSNTKEILNSGTKFDLISSTNDIQASDIQVYPNPVKDVLNLDLGQSTTASVNVVITNMFGREIKSNFERQNNTLIIPVGDLPRGIYFARINVGDRTITKKWIKS